MAVQYPARAAVTQETIQKYASIMEATMKEKFPYLYKMDDSLYIMMATMGLESSYRVHPRIDSQRVSTANHVTIGTAGGIGKSYWEDPLIIPLRGTNKETNAVEGLSAKALMASMGMYQVRGTRQSKGMITGAYLGYAEEAGCMVNPGDSISAVFPNDDSGATRSILLGCIVMEKKLRDALSAGNNYTAATQLAIQGYLGRAGAKDVLGTSPEMRLADIQNGKGGVAQRLASAGIVKGNSSGGYTQIASSTQYLKPPKQPSGTAETKTTTVASTDGVPTSISGCIKRVA